MMKPLSWSYSVLDSFETCERRHNLVRVLKVVTEPQGEALKYGNEVHKALELRLKGEAPLPVHLIWLDSITNLLMRQHGRRLVEARWAVDKAFRPTDYHWKNANAWCRGIVDIGIVGATSAVLIDWKTGSRKPASDQLELLAGLAFAHYPFLEEVYTAFIWLKEKKIDKERYTHDQVGKIWSKFMPRVQRLELAHEKNVWQPKPSGLCGKWCPVTRQHCEFGKP